MFNLILIEIDLSCLEKFQAHQDEVEQNLRRNSDNFISTVSTEKINDAFSPVSVSWTIPWFLNNKAI